jgi:catalase (peroxidase I)
MDRSETLTNEFFVDLLDMSTEWKASSSSGKRLVYTRLRGS